MTDIIAGLRHILGDKQVLVGAAAEIRNASWETHQPCRAKALLRPGSTADVAAILKLCNQLGQTVVPFGGLTNLVQACTTTPDDIALSFARMHDIEETDATEQTLTAQAGATMQQLQSAAERAGLLFPIDIGARGSCEVGGFVSTNAGGSRVIRYGMTRDSVLGLEAVLADGTIISSMNRYIKNNSGFDLKQLFIGSEGLLGVITRVVFRLSVKPSTHNVALVACADYAQVVVVLSKARELLGASLCGFEVMWDSFYRKAVEPEGRHESPFSESYAIYAIIESMGTHSATDEERFMAALESLFSDGLVLDAVIAKSEKECAAIWAIRGEVEWLVNTAQNFDVSLRSRDMAQYVADITDGIRADFPGATVATFGHLGDNNMHVSVLTGSETVDARERVERCIYESLVPFQGAISAEHGIGVEKQAWLGISRSAAEIELMKTLKATLDPHNILNPGKVLEGELREE